jgi:hypothetical protein
MESSQFELIVSQPKNPIWKIILSGIFFAFAIRSIITIALQPQFSHLEPEDAMLFNKNVFVAMAGIAGGIYYSVRLTILIDTDKGKLVSRYFLGFFSIDKTTEIPELSHIAVSKNPDGIYMINLWYKARKPYNMCNCDEKKAAFEFAAMAARKLHTDLLDATNKADLKWIEKEVRTSD